MSKVVMWEELHKMNKMNEIHDKVAESDEAMEAALEAVMMLRSLGETHVAMYLFGLLSDKDKFIKVMDTVQDAQTKIAEYLYNALTKQQLEDLVDVSVGTAMYNIMTGEA